MILADGIKWVDNGWQIDYTCGCRTQVEDTDDAYIVKFNVAGYPKDDLEVKLIGTTLRVNSVSEEKNLHLYKLPEQYRNRDAEAEYCCGLLTVNVDKTVENRTIKVK